MPGLPSAITSLMKETVTVRTESTEDAYGKKTYASTTVKAYVDYKRRNVQAGANEDTVSEVQVYLAEDVAALKPQDELTLPDGSVRKIKEVRRPAWPEGFRHVEVLL